MSRHRERLAQAAIACRSTRPRGHSMVMPRRSRIEARGPWRRRSPICLNGHDHGPVAGAGWCGRAGPRSIDGPALTIASVSPHMLIARRPRAPVIVTREKTMCRPLRRRIATRRLPPRHRLRAMKRCAACTSSSATRGEARVLGARFSPRGRPAAPDHGSTRPHVGRAKRSL